MRNKDTEIWLALKARIDTLVTNPTMLVFEPGATIDTPKDAAGPLPFITVSDVRNDPARFGIDPKLHERTGTLMLAIQWPIARQVSHTQLIQLGGDVAAHFPADTRMKTGSTCLRVTQDSAPMQPYRDGAFHVVMVRVFWSTT
jgi:Bacteriophage related domain of unknown function